MTRWALMVAVTVAFVSTAQAEPKAPNLRGAKPIPKLKLDWRKVVRFGTVRYQMVDDRNRPVRKERFEQSAFIRRDEVKFVDRFTGYQFKDGGEVKQVSYAKLADLRLRKVILKEIQGNGRVDTLIHFINRPSQNRADRMIHVFGGRKNDRPTHAFTQWRPGVVSGLGLIRAASLLPRKVGGKYVTEWTHEYGDWSAVGGYLIECVGPRTVKNLRTQRPCTLYRYWAFRRATFDGSESMTGKQRLRAEVWVGASGRVERMKLFARHHWGETFARAD